MKIFQKLCFIVCLYKGNQGFFGLSFFPWCLTCVCGTLLPKAMADRTKIVLALTFLSCVRINPLSHCTEDDGRWLPLLRPPLLIRLIVSQHTWLPQALRHCCCWGVISGIVPFPFFFRLLIATSYFSVCLTLPDRHSDKPLYVPLVSFVNTTGALEKNKMEKVEKHGCYPRTCGQVLMSVSWGNVSWAAGVKGSRCAVQGPAGVRKVVRYCCLRRQTRGRRNERKVMQMLPWQNPQFLLVCHRCMRLSTFWAQHFTCEAYMLELLYRHAYRR